MHVNFSRVTSRSNGAAKLLKLLAFLNPDNILVEFLQAGREGLCTELQEIIGNDPFELNRALFHLTQSSLIDRSNDGKRIKIHRLIQAVVKDVMPETERDIYLCMVVAMFNSAYPSKLDDSTRYLCSLYQGQVVEPLILNVNIVIKEVGDIAFRIGNFLLEDGMYHDSSRLLEKAVSVYGAISAKNHSDNLNAMMSLAEAYRGLDRQKDAVGLWERVLQASKIVRIAQNSDKAMEDSAILLSGQHQNELAEQHPATLAAMANLASAHRSKGEWKEAIELERKVLEAKRRIFGNDHTDTLNAMASLASTYRSLGEWTEAIPLEKTVLEVRTRLLGARHPDTLTAMDDLASTYSSQGRLDEAVVIEEEVLAARKAVLGDAHPDTLTAIENLSSTYSNQGRWDQSMALEKSLPRINRERPIDLDSPAAKVQAIKLLRDNKRAPLVATCASSSGEIIALLGEKECWVYKLTSYGESFLEAKLVIKLTDGGIFISYRQSAQQSDYRQAMNVRNKKILRFRCAAISDTLLAIASNSGWLQLFSLEDGSNVFNLEQTNLIATKLFFNTEGSELVMVSALCKYKDICQVYSVSQPSPADASENPLLEHNCSIQLDMTYTQVSFVCRFATRDAKFSIDGSKIVACTGHNYGCALVFILSKNNQNIWQFSGRHLLEVAGLDVWDEGCLGFTGVAL